MFLHSKESANKRNNLMIQRRKLSSKLLPDSKTQEEKANEEISFFNALNAGDLGLATG